MTQDPRLIGQRIEAIFERIHRERMQGLPLLNPAIGVQAVGFQLYDNRIIGIIVTPWLMNLVMLPGMDDEWDELELGAKRWHRLGARQYKFMVNEIDGLGVCQTHSLHSPMRAFSSHQCALNAAQAFLAELEQEPEASGENEVDEDLLGRLMRGEIPPDMDFSQLESTTVNTTELPPGGEPEDGISRRALLRGELS